MAWIKMVSDAEATGLLQKIFESCRERAGKVWNIIRLTSLRPRVTRDHLAIYQTIMFGDSSLSRAERELVATVVSKTNHCHY